MFDKQEKSWTQGELARMAYHYNNSKYNDYSYNTRFYGFVFKQELRDNGAVDSDTNASAQSEIKEICDYLIKNYEELPEEQKKYYFGKTNPDTKRFECWLYAYPLFIACAYEQGKQELFKELVKKYKDKVYPSGYKFDLTPLLKPLMQSYEDDKRRSLKRSAFLRACCGWIKPLKAGI